MSLPGSRPFSALAAAEDAPHRPALIAGGEVWTFRQLAEAVRPIAARFQARDRGVDPAAPAALLGSPRPSSLLGLYGLLEAAWPVVLIHPRWTAAERRVRIGSIAPRPIPEEAWRLPAGRPEASGGPPATPEDSFFALVFTSGSGGEPKGAVLSHRALAAAAAASGARLGWREGDRWLLSLPIAHVGGLSIVTRCLAARRTVVLSSSLPFDPRAFDEELRRQRVTLVSLVPTMLRRLLDLYPAWEPPDHLRVVLLGGAPAPVDLLAEAADRGVPVLTTYGLTEAASQVATQAPGTVNRGELGAGEALPGVQVRIREGEIQVRGEVLMEGYWPLEESVQPFTEDGWLATGDLGRLDDEGNLHVQGRRSETLISGGENVHPAEVEAVLCGHPSLASACVFGIEDREWGQRIVAALVAGEGGAPTDRELLELLHQRLAGFKRPRRIAYLDALSLLPNGKLDRPGTAERARPHLRPLGRS